MNSKSKHVLCFVVVLHSKSGQEMFNAVAKADCSSMIMARIKKITFLIILFFVVMILLSSQSRVYTRLGLFFYLIAARVR